ncbi:MAG: bacteriohemerythrin [Actinomycetota bacterium]
MPIIEWTPDLSVGVDVLDAHHQRLLTLLDEVYQVLRTPRPERTVGHVLDEMIAYTHYHFEEEERLLEAAGWPECETHRRSHAMLAEQVRAMMGDYAADPRGVLAAELFEFLSDWLIRHIRHEDMRYKDALSPQTPRGGANSATRGA